jgi:hypothetical protein
MKRHPPFSVLLSLIIVIAPLLVIASSGVGSAGALDSMRDAVADAIDSSSETAGYLLGFLVIILVFILAAFFFRDGSWKIHAIFGFTAMGFCVLIGWFPIWFLIFMVIGFAVLLIGMPGVSED